jgi:GNAT superfamily N-acetyltransferase
MACDVLGSWATYGVGLGMDGPVAGATLDALVAFYQSRDRQPRVKITPHQHPSLVRGLTDRGFTVFEQETVLVHSLEQLPSNHSLPGLVFRLIDPSSPEDLEAFWASQTRGFFEDDEAPAGLRPIFERTVRHPRCTCWIMEYKGQVVGSGGFETFENSGVLMAGCVHPEARRQGLHSAFIKFRIQAAREAGLQYAVIVSLAGESTHRNALRTGFTVAYTQHNLHLQT